jgi:hypothetical protein
MTILLSSNEYVRRPLMMEGRRVAPQAEEVLSPPLTNSCHRRSCTFYVDWMIVWCSHRDANLRLTLSYPLYYFAHSQRKKYSCLQNMPFTAIKAPRITAQTPWSTEADKTQHRPAVETQDCDRNCHGRRPRSFHDLACRSCFIT